MDMPCKICEIVETLEFEPKYSKDDYENLPARLQEPSLSYYFRTHWLFHGPLATLTPEVLSKIPRTRNKYLSAIGKGVMLTTDDIREYAAKNPNMSFGLEKWLSFWDSDEIIYISEEHSERHHEDTCDGLDKLDLIKKSLGVKD